LRTMADDPLDEWRETVAADRQRAGLLPDGQVKNLLNEKLREMELLLRVVSALAKNDPFRDRVKSIARRMKETPSSEAKERSAVLRGFAACVNVARRMDWTQAALDAKRWPKGE
jgi:hypothetical protein